MDGFSHAMTSMCFSRFLLICGWNIKYGVLKHGQKIVTHAYIHDMDSCKIFVVSNASNTTSSNVLKCTNIIGDIIDLDGLKVVEIPKAQKWWKNLND